MRRFLTAAVAAICTGLSATALAQNISIGTGGTGGVYYPHGRRHRLGAFQVRAGHAGDGGGDRRLGRQPEADRHRQALCRLLDDRRGAGRVQGRGQVQGHQGAAAHADDPVPEPHARGDGRGHRDQQDRRPEGQAGLDGLAGQRHRGDGVPRHRGRRPGQGQGHEARAARRGRVGQRDEGPEDRRLLLGRRPADRRGDRPGATRRAPRSR